MLVNAKEMLDKALNGHYAIPQININNLEWTKAALLATRRAVRHLFWVHQKVLANGWEGT